MLVELPERAQTHLQDLETLLARDQVTAGKEILARLGTEILISRDGIVEVRGDLGKALALVAEERQKIHSVGRGGGI